MTSEATDEEPGDDQPTMKCLNINSRLRNICCPFTWRMDTLVTQNTSEEKNMIIFQRALDMNDVFPESIFIYHIIQAYVAAKRDHLLSAIQSINQAEQSLADIEEKGTLEDIDVLHRIFVGTKSHVLRSLPQLTEVEELLKGIPSNNPKNKMKLAMLSGCQCSAWTIYPFDDSKAINCANKAIEWDPSNGKWYFLLGKNYRRRRRHQSPFLKPEFQEIEAFERAYIFSRNILFGVSLARAYREASTYNRSTKYTMAITIYMEVKAMQPTCCKVYLHLALGFIRTQKEMLAKQCLDYVAKNKMPDDHELDIRYTHYMGLYHEKGTKNVEAALYFYKISSEKFNFASERQYIDCRHIVEPEWDPLPYMLNLLKKYEGRADHVIQQINTEIGLYFLFSMHDVLSACQYLDKAIEIEPNARILKTHIPVLGQSPRINVYKTFEAEIRFALEVSDSIYTDDKITMLKNSLEICRKNSQNVPAHDALSSRVENPDSHSSAETMVGAQELEKKISRGSNIEHCELNNLTGNCSATRECSRGNIKRTGLSSPFDWDIENIVTLKNRLTQGKEDRYQRVLDMQEIFPECIFIYHLMRSYEDVKSNDLPSAVQSINDAEQSLADIKEKATLKDVENVLQHIYVQTKFHVLQKLGQLTEADELLKGIHTIKDFREANELATLSGCECLAWSIYATDNFKAIICSTEAVQYEPGNAKWHFLLGENYRRLRRYKACHHKPQSNELTAFEKAYILSPNSLFAVSLARSYWESSKHSMSNEIYKQIHALQPTSCQVQLQLALGFILLKESKLAKDCLDYIAAKMPDSVRYNHYMGIYEEKCNKDFKAALSYYERATVKLSYAAERYYIECRKREEPDWDPLPYILGLLKKYHECADHVILAINTEIGLYYLLKLDDVLSACQYFIKADEIQPNADTLKSYLPLLSKPPRVNVYEILGEKIQIALETDDSSYDKDTIAMLKDTLQLCNKTIKYLPPKRQNLQSLKYGKGFYSCIGANMIPEKPWLSFRGSWKEYSGRSRGFKRDFSNIFHTKPSTSSWRSSNSDQNYGQAFSSRFQMHTGAGKLKWRTNKMERGSSNSEAERNETLERESQRVRERIEGKRREGDE